MTVPESLELEFEIRAEEIIREKAFMLLNPARSLAVKLNPMDMLETPLPHVLISASATPLNHRSISGVETELSEMSLQALKLLS